ncbi:serine hydrolase-like protein 2 isoform X4 [Lacerta agilis]|uniref:serine hydrolase-like protein 2 isoform X4 n=1 Tax=Lacerta agilis TaxID=80427 RepID=UPI001419AEC4|nr:serine hydrolase-like protein 2 isoform X4 [Lacerta agilis]
MKLMFPDCSKKTPWSTVVQSHHQTVASRNMISEMKLVVPWGHIAAKAWGSPQGRPVLCLHGWLDNANTFNRLIPLLPKDCYYMAIDLAGHGLSSHRPPGAVYHFLDYVGDVRRVAAAMKWNRFTLMGHSLGGSIAGMFSCIFPELVDKLILVESYGFYPAPQGYQRGPGLHAEKKPRFLFTPRDAFSRLEEVEKICKSQREVIEELLNFETSKYHSPKVRSPEAALQRLLEANSHLTEESAKVLMERGASEVAGGLVYNRDLRVLVQNSSFVSLDQCCTILKKIEADILMIRAQNGIFTNPPKGSTPYFVEPLEEAFRTSLKERYQFVEVAGNHFVHLNEPQVVAGIINTFLNKDQKPRASL